MKRRSKATVLILLAVILAGLGWWAWPKGVVTKVAAVTVGAQTQALKLQENVAQVEAPKLPPVTPVANPSAVMANATDKKDQPTADNELGNIDFGVVPFQGPGISKRFSLKSGRTLEVTVKQFRDESISYSVSTVDPEPTGFRRFSLGNRKPGEPFYAKLDGGETVNLTALATSDPNDQGLLDLGYVDLHNGVTKTFTLLSGRTFSLQVVADQNGQPVLDYAVHDADGRFGGSGWGGYHSGNSITQELGNEAVNFTPLF
jgi:hypothetical protein